MIKKIDHQNLKICTPTSHVFVHGAPLICLPIFSLRQPPCANNKGDFSNF